MTVCDEIASRLTHWNTYWCLTSISTSLTLTSLLDNLICTLFNIISVIEMSQRTVMLCSLVINHKQKEVVKNYSTGNGRDLWDIHLFEKGMSSTYNESFIVHHKSYLT